MELQRHLDVLHTETPAFGAGVTVNMQRAAWGGGVALKKMPSSIVSPWRKQATDGILYFNIALKRVI